MNQTFNPWLKLNKGTVVGDIGDSAVELAAHRVFQIDAFPWIGFQLLHAQRNTLGFGIEADHLDFHGLANLQGFAWMVDPTPGDIGDMEQAIDAAQIHESTIIGDVFNHPLKDLTFFQIGHQFRACFGP